MAFAVSLKNVNSAPAGLRSAPPVAAADARLDKLRSICQQYEIRADFAARLRQLEGFEIVFLIDDSGSMNTPTAPVSSADPFGKQPTRWSEAQQLVNRVVDLATCFDPDGIDLRFLNRSGYSNVTTAFEVARTFDTPPSGMTPLAAAFDSIMYEKRAVVQEKKLLVIIATDGQPTNASGAPDVAEFTRALGRRHQNVHVTIVACTDDDASVGYLNGLDDTCPRLDVCDDYISERKEVLAAQGPHFAFTLGDYVVKIMLGSIDPFFDKLDEKKGGSCVVS